MEINRTTAGYLNNRMAILSCNQAFAATEHGIIAGPTFSTARLVPCRPINLGFAWSALVSQRLLYNVPYFNLIRVLERPLAAR